MTDERPGAGVERRLDTWLREEAEMRAPDRLIETVFATTEASRQVGRGWLGWLRLRAGATGRRPGALLAVGLVGLAVLGLGVGLVGNRSGPAPGNETAPRSIAVLERWATCSPATKLALLRDATSGAGTAPAAWVVCGGEAREVAIGGRTVANRAGLSLAAGDDAAPWAIRGDSLVRLGADRVPTDVVKIGTPGALAADGGTAWVIDVGSRRLSAVTTNGVAWTVTPAPGGRPVAVTLSAGSLWVLDQAVPRIVRLDPADGRILATTAVPADPTLITPTAGAVLVASGASNTLVRIDAATNTATRIAIDLGIDGRLAPVDGTGSLLLVGSRTWVLVIDPATGATVAGRDAGGYVVGVARIDATRMLVLTDDGVLVEATIP